MCISITRLRSRFFSDKSLPIDVLEYNNLQFLAAGASGIVYAIDSNRVIKQFNDETAENERRAYVRIGSHPNITKLIGVRADGSVILERGRPLRLDVLQGQENISQQQKIRWIIEAAEAIRHIHRQGLIHADIGCHNAVLIRNRLKLIDFAGSSIDGEPATSGYEWFSYRELDDEIIQQNDIFAYGCMVYEIVTGRPPYHEYEKHPDRYRLVPNLYTEGQYPDLDGITFGELIKGCWHGNLTTMQEVIRKLKSEVKLLDQSSIRTSTLRSSWRMCWKSRRNSFGMRCCWWLGPKCIASTTY